MTSTPSPPMRPLISDATAAAIRNVRPDLAPTLIGSVAALLGLLTAVTVPYRGFDGAFYRPIAWWPPGTLLPALLFALFATGLALPGTSVCYHGPLPAAQPPKSPPPKSPPPKSPQPPPVSPHPPASPP